MSTLQTVLALWPLAAFVIAALWIAAAEARPVHRCACGKRAEVRVRGNVETRLCTDCTEQFALSATIRSMSHR